MLIVENWLDRTLCLPLLQFDQVAKIVEVLGIPPDHILHMASRTEKFFEKGTSGNWMLKRLRGDNRKVRIVHSC
jgi:hypothetical protein